MRVIIVGAGVVGAMAAWRLAKAGHDVVVLEQFKLDHDRGSSFGDSRVVRCAYPESFYSTLMHATYPLWHELQSHYPDHELFSPSGGLFFGPEGDPQLAMAESSLNAAGVAFERLDAQECTRRFPAFKFRDDEVGLFEPTMGYVRASRCVIAAAELARRHGAVIHEETPVSAITPVSSGGVRVTTQNGETLAADRLLICAGPWLGKVLGEQGIALPLRVIRKTYIHLQPADREDTFDVGRFPVWIDARSWAYGFPRLGDVPGVKLAIHAGGEDTTPDKVDREMHENDRRALLDYARERFPHLSQEVVYQKVCLYTMTPDENFIIDQVSQLPGVFVIGGLSGHGFKFGPLLGEIGRLLVEGELVPYNLSPFSTSRFA